MVAQGSREAAPKPLPEPEREQLVADLAEQCRHGGTRERSAVKAQHAAWRRARATRLLAELDDDNRSVDWSFHEGEGGSSDRRNGSGRRD